MITQSRNEFLTLNLIRGLNARGQEKVLEYISDILDSGKYGEKK